MRCVRLVQRSQGLPGNGDGPWAASARLCLGRWQMGWELPAHATNRPALANGAPAILEPERPRRNSAVITGAVARDRRVARAGPGLASRGSTALGAWWGELRSDLRDADFGICWLRLLSAAAVPRESPPDLARLWHGALPDP